MGATIYHNNNGEISSIRSTIKVGNNKVENSYYLKDGKGGTTFRNNSLTTRLNSDGKALGVGMGSKRKQYYDGLSFNSNIPRFR